MGYIETIQKKVPCLMSRRFSFVSMTLLLSAFFLVEVIVGYMTNSMALIADSFHMLSDVASLVVGFLALKYSSHKAPREIYTYGYARAEVLGALVNAVFLVALCFSILIEALKRLVILEEIENPLLVFCVGAAGLVVNIFGMFLFHQTGHGHTHGGMSHSHGSRHGHSHGDEVGHGHSHGGHGPSHNKEAGHGHSHGTESGHEHSHNGHGNSHESKHSHSHGSQSSSLESIKEIHRKDKTEDMKIGFDIDNLPDHSEACKQQEADIETRDTELLPEKMQDKSNSEQSRDQLITDIVPEQKIEIVPEQEIEIVPEQGIEIAEEPNENSKLLPQKTNDSLDSSANLEQIDNERFPKTRSAGQLNIHAVYLHILGDALGSVIVMISALIILYATGTWTLYVDPVMSIIMVAIILKTSIPLLVETSKILMNSVPHHIQINELRERLKKQMPQIKNVHELHVWQLAGDKIIASAHVKFETPEDYDETASKIKEFFHNEGIHSTTVQIEFEKGEDDISRRGQCMVVCSLDSACDDMMCCKPE